MTPIEKFQSLLRDLFQFDCADLDFGIYRIMNRKRAVIEQFIAQDLPKAIAQELARGALAEQQQAQQTLREARQKVLDALGEDALDADGNLVEKYRETKAGKEYLEAKAKAAGSRSTEALETAIYNHLYTFFSRYWQEGDFISKRRYSKKERYAIPYNGEEVTLYWANHDQYYVKTGEYFTDYTYQAPSGVTAHFKLRQADVEQNNVKGEKRFFLPRLDEIVWDEAARTLTIPFEFRPLTEQENIAYGQKNQQEAIVAKAVAEIPKRVKAAEALAALTAERRRTEKGEPVTWLEHHLRQYTRRNTSDFFIHKDLRGFLSRELDFYLKNEVLNLEEMEAAGEGLTEGWFQLMRLIKRIGLAIIEFLAQIEDFQKTLWEKKKFVTETFYVITVGNIPQDFYPEIAECEAQWAEWKTLYGIEIPPSPHSPSPHRGEGWGEGMKSRTKAERSALITQLAREMRQAPTDAENRLWYFVRDRRLGGWKFRRQHSVDRYIVDFICIEGGLIVELDGGQHAEDEQRKKDEERTRFLEGRGFRVLRFWNHEVLKNTQGVLETILEALENAPHPNPLPREERGYAPHPNPLPREERGYAPHPNPLPSGEREAFLKAHPTLPLDTRHFSPEFVDRLLASFENLDEMTDGLLVHSENWQALNLLQEKYRERARQIHIDPPYNTESSGFVYKNDYRHSSWLSMMMERLTLAKGVLHLAGIFTCHIDENEFERLRLLFEQIFGYVGTAVWDKLNPMMGAQELAIQHEYILFCAPESRPFIVRPQNVKAILAMAREIIRKYGGVTEQAKKEFSDWVRSTKSLTGGERAYQYLDDDGQVYRLVAMTWPNPSPPPPEFFTPLIHPITGKPCPVPNRGWSQSPKKMLELLEKGEIVFGPDETTQPQRKVRLSEGKALSSIIRNGSRGKTEIESLGLDFTYNHPSTLYTTLLDAGLDEAGLVLDFFAGSGTTGHAVINLNREDGGRRKFILVEMAHYFDTVLLPRVKKVTFTPEWKDGKPLTPHPAPSPQRGEGRGEGYSPRIVKVIRLESYEDALNNLTFDEESGQQALKLFGDEYLLSYMLRWETRHSETLLNVEQLQSPFSYKLHLHRDGETHERLVDLPETFAYLLGLDVQTRRVHPSPQPSPPWGEGAAEQRVRGKYLVYRGVLRNGRTVAVIWRETQGWTAEDYERDAAFVAEQELAAGADEIYVNGDSRIPGARSLDPIFKERMFAGVEA